MKRFAPMLWPLLVGVASLAVTAGLWSHERETQQRHLRDNFDFGLRLAAARIEQRMSSYEQMLQGARGLFEASSGMDRAGFAAYVDALLAGADLNGLRGLAFAPLLEAGELADHVAAQRGSGLTDYQIRPPGARELYAPVTFAAPLAEGGTVVLGLDPLADPLRRAAMMQARDSGRVVLTDRVKLVGPPEPTTLGFNLFMPLYAKGRPIDSLQARRAHLVGWVFASVRLADMMSSLYGEGTPGLEVRVYDGVDNRAAARIYPPADAASAPARAARFEALEYIGFAGHTWTLEVRSTPDFERRYSSDSARIIAIAGSGLSLLLALLTWQLVTGRERAHDAAQAMTRQLRDSAQRYQRIVETASEGIWMVDAEGRTSFVNPKLAQMLGQDAGAMLGRPWTAFLDDETRAAVGTAGLAAQPELRLQRRDGSALWTTVSSSPLVDGEGRDAGVLAMVTDVSDRKADETRRALLEQQLRQAQKMEAIGTLAGGIAHDFNNILAAILGHASLLRQDLGADHPASVHLEQIAKSGGRARSLVQQIAAFSRQQPPRLQRQPLQALVDETVGLLRSMLPALAELQTRSSAAPLVVDADATQLQQVLMNLCTNAWHALQGQPGHIVVGLEAVELDAEAAARLGAPAAGSHAHLWVSDDGCGMDEATLQRIFEPFFTTKPVGQGTGLGLSAVHGIVSAHRGAIRVHSVPGQGSRFDLFLPLVAADAAAPAVAEAARPAPSGRGEHVLYVDDDAVMVTLVQALLRRAGYRVTGLTDPQLALQRLREQPAAFDLLVTDYNMPELSGLALARALSQIRPSMPVVISSGYVTDAMRTEARHAGVRWLLQKEYTLEQLAGTVREALAPGGAVAHEA